MRIGGIVLCGGKSTRMGLPKATLPFGSELMLQRVVRLLGQVVQPLLVVAAPGQQLPSLPSGTMIAHDEREGQGPLQGLHAGLSAIAAEADAAYVTSCDVPLLVDEFVRMLLDRLQHHDIVVPVERQFHHPLAALYRTSVVPQIRKLLDEGRLRPLFLFDQAKTCRVPIDELRRVDPQLRTLANLNTPADYFAALATAGFEAPPEIRTKLAKLKESSRKSG